MIYLIDNEDSFVYTLARYVRLCGHPSKVIRCDQIKSIPTEVKGLIISPGPCAPKDTPQTNAIIKKHAPHIPILGVCLGHQCIGHVFGCNIIKTPPVHGETSVITHNNNSLFSNIPNGSEFTRYHSLAIEHTNGTPI